MSGHLLATSLRAIRTGNFSPLKPGNDRMPGMRFCSSCIFGLSLSLIAAATTPASALNLRGARVETLNFSMLDGWKSDDHAQAFETFLKSCRAILKNFCEKRPPLLPPPRGESPRRACFAAPFRGGARRRGRPPPPPRQAGE